MCDNCVKVNKKPGQEHEDLLSEDEPNVGLWDSISRLAAVYFFTTSSQQQSVHFKFMFSFHCGQHNVSLQAFADDTQLYLHCHRTDTTSAAAQLEQYITDVGCLSTASSSTWTKLSCCGSDRDTVFPSKTVVFQFYNSVLTP